MIKRVIEAMTRSTPEERAVEKAAKQLIKGDRTSTLKLFQAGVYDRVLFSDSENGTNDRD